MKSNKQRSFGLADILVADDLSKVLASILSFISVFLILGSLAYVINPNSANLTVTKTSLLLVGVTLFSVILTRKKRPNLAVLVMLIACGTILFLAAWNGAGIMGPAFIVCGLLVLGAALYWGQRIGMLTALIAALAGSILVAAGRAGWLVNNERSIEDWFMWAVLTAGFTLMALMPGLVLEYLEKLVSQVRQDEDEVRRLNDDLEQRVADRTIQLAESEQLLKIISANVQDVIWTMDFQLRATFVSDSAARLRGFAPEEIKNEPLQHALTPDSYMLAVQALQEELQNETKENPDPNRSRVLHLDYNRKDGSTIRMEVRASFLRDEHGKAIGITGVNRDISERHWMEKALLESEERYRKIASVISDYSYSAVVDTQGNYKPEWVAGAFADITGYEFDEYQADGGWENLLHPDSRAQDMLDRDVLLANQPVEGSVLKIRRKDGQIRWVRNFAYPVWNKSEARLTGVFGGVQDITIEKLATDRLQSLNSELEKRVAERTTKLENALAELESFSYSISHDLRAPLRAVNGYAGMLLAEHHSDFPPDIIAKLSAIKENGQRMGQLVDGLLQFLHSGSEQIERQIVNPGEIVQSVLERLRPQYEGRQVKITIANLPPCSANLRLLDKVYEGLISNAIKFTRNCPVSQIEIGVLERDDRQVYFVRDNGAGFDMKYYDKLFGVFQRLHHVSEFEGIGASLAIVQRIINRHGGRVWAEAEVDKGATFFFTIE